MVKTLIPLICVWCFRIISFFVWRQLESTFFGALASVGALFVFMEDTIMNNDSTPEKNATAKPKALKILGYAVCFFVTLAIILGVKSCVKNLGMPEEFKDSKKILEKEGYSCRYLDAEEDFEDLFDELDIAAEGAEEVLVAYDEDSEDWFLITCCDDISAAKDLEFELAWELAGDDYLYNRGYDTRVNYRTVYFGHRDLIDAILD